MKNVKKDKSGKILAFTISRKTWLRGKGHIFSALLYSKDNNEYFRSLHDLDHKDVLKNVKIHNSCLNKMCCLGIGSIACGVPKKDIVTVQAPNAIKNKKSYKKLLKGLPWLFNRNMYGNQISDAALYAMDINDNEKLSSRQRESRLKKLFKANGCTIKFVL